MARIFRENNHIITIATHPEQHSLFYQSPSLSSRISLWKYITEMTQIGLTFRLTSWKRFYHWKICIWSDMKKSLILLVAVVGLILPACRFGQSFDSHELSPGQVTLRKEPAYSWIFADLGRNGYENLLSAAPQGSQSMLLVKDQSGKDISQINYPQKIRSMAVLTDPRDKQQWMFLGVNDQKQTTLNAYRYIWESTLGREEKSFEAIARTDTLINRPDYEWFGILNPRLLEDIDNDGNPELVCVAQDAFTVNPRGLVVYDFDSGRVKWRLVLTTSIISLLCDDFNGDGAKELICGTVAFKNSSLELAGMDDFHSWLIALNAQGEMLARELVNAGLSQVLLASDDINQDGLKEILAVASTKGNAEKPNKVEWLSWTGSRFVSSKSWSLEGNFEGNTDSTIYGMIDQDGRKLILLTALNSPLIVLDKDLNVVHHRFKEPVSQICGIADLDGDGSKEVLLQTQDNRFVILSSDLLPSAELQNPFPLSEHQRVHIVGTGFGKPPKVAIGSAAEVRYYDYKRLPLGALIIRFIKADMPYIGLFLLMALLFLGHMIVVRRRLFLQTVNNLSQGVVLMVLRDRIIYINDYLLDQVRDENGNLPPGNPKSLQNLLPGLSTLFAKFLRSRKMQYHGALMLGKKQIMHAVHFQKYRTIPVKYLITLQPEVAVAESHANTLAWAETARRLSHNVRRHITNIILALKPLQADGLNEHQQKYTEIIRSEIEKIRVFTHAFQRFTELKDYDLKPQDVIPSLEHCLERLNIPENVRLIKSWELNSVEAWIEPIRFEEAFTNVVTNALDAMPEGGILHLSVKKFPHHTSPQGPLSVMIEVEDSGRGIPAKYMDEIWQPFFTVKDSGTGIGLPETKKIIESMGGTILVQSEEEAGTVVTFWLKGMADG